MSTAHRAKLQVAVRVRPLLTAEEDRGNSESAVSLLTGSEGSEVSVGKLNATFDSVFAVSILTLTPILTL